MVVERVLPVGLEDSGIDPRHDRIDPWGRQAFERKLPGGDFADSPDRDVSRKVPGDIHGIVDIPGTTGALDQGPRFFRHDSSRL